nr:MAG TPA: hypothetical protein [Caudoviricetes sp.]
MFFIYPAPFVVYSIFHLEMFVKRFFHNEI